MSLKVRRLWHRLLFGLAFAACATLLFTAAVLLIALQALKPDPDEWQTTLQIGPWQRDLSVPGLIRWAAHPLAAPLLDGRVLQTRWGRWQLQRSGAQLQAVCAPCRLNLAALGPAPLQVARAVVLAQHEGAGRFAGTLSLADSGHRVDMSFTAQLQRRGADVRLSMPATPMASLVAVFGHDLPEAASVQVSGTLAFVATAQWPDGAWQARPVVTDFAVAGLGTERLLDAQLPPACRTG
ncbi:MAG TPA: hypothetical protein VFK10_18015, partial [Burkholderiaceae bacterium]|nr:hypothetical protein [Burkholderiaceae bacterium]